MSSGKTRYAKYDAAVVSLTVIGFLIPLILGIVFLVFSYQRTVKRAQSAQRDATQAAKAFCTTFQSIEKQDRIADAIILESIGPARDQISQGCRQLLA